MRWFWETLQSVLLLPALLGTSFGKMELAGNKELVLSLLLPSNLYSNNWVGFYFFIFCFNCLYSKCSKLDWSCPASLILAAENFNDVKHLFWVKPRKQTNMFAWNEEAASSKHKGVQSLSYKGRKLLGGKNSVILDINGRSSKLGNSICGLSLKHHKIIILPKISGAQWTVQRWR